MLDTDIIKALEAKRAQALADREAIDDNLNALDDEIKAANRRPKIPAIISAYGGQRVALKCKATGNTVATGAIEYIGRTHTNTPCSGNYVVIFDKAPYGDLKVLDLNHTDVFDGVHSAEFRSAEAVLSENVRTAYGLHSAYPEGLDFTKVR